MIHPHSKILRASSPVFPSAGRRPAISLGLVAALLATLAVNVRAGLSEPDNILYGSINLVGRGLITAADTDVVVEARKTPTGPAIATYRLGSAVPAGDHYVLRVAVEATAGGALKPRSVLVGTEIHLVVRDDTGDLAQQTWTIPARGIPQRLDFGSADPNLNGDGDNLPDAWELARLGDLTSNGLGDRDQDGQNDRAEYTSGTNPRDPADQFRLLLNVEPGQPTVTISFLARQASGPGYAGKERRYAVEAASPLPTGPWRGLAGQTNILGNNQTVSLVQPQTNAPVFYRARVWLTP